MKRKPKNDVTISIDALGRSSPQVWVARFEKNGVTERITGSGMPVLIETIKFDELFLIHGEGNIRREHVREPLIRGSIVERAKRDLQLEDADFVMSSVSSAEKTGVITVTFHLKVGGEKVVRYGVYTGDRLA